MTRQSEKSPIFLATHPRAMSTALERSFMTRPDVRCMHEPYGDAFYFGPERLSDRYSAQQRASSKYSETTYAHVTKDILDQSSGRRTFIKDMAQYVIPSDGKASVAPSLGGNGHEKGNSTVLPRQILDKFKFFFLVRPPHKSVPSYYRCCIPPRSATTGFDHYRHSEAGFRELRILYDYLVENGQTPLVVDAEDIVRDPEQTIKAICEAVDLDFDPAMLSWDKDQDVIDTFQKWNGWHTDVLSSKGFEKGEICEFKIDWDAWEKEWAAKYDEKGVEIIRDSVKKSLDDYLYLRQHKFQLK
jgi:hypothetical protein